MMGQFMLSFGKIIMAMSMKLKELELTKKPEQKLLRSFLLDRKDLHNISRDFNIDYATKKHKNDAISIKLWVEEMKTLEKQCPFLYYKGQDENDWIGEQGVLDKKDFTIILLTNFQEKKLKKFGHNKICIGGSYIVL
ncbi:hypothetical protein QTP88_001995 [Uroleucon formosanum]